MLSLYQRRGLEFKYKERLKITEVFHSLQGEGQHSGLPCTFVRLTGCALRCTYCDSEYAFYGGQWQSFEDLFGLIARNPTKLVQITGGEPLHQKAVWPFIDELVARGYRPLLETSGAVSTAGLHEQTHVVLDMKTPESGEHDKMDWSNLERLRPSDELKFVVCSQADLNWSLDLIRERQLDQRCSVLISPIWTVPHKGQLAEEVAASGLYVRFQIQLHKILWGDVPGK